MTVQWHAPRRPPKYRNEKRVVDGHTFDSAKEMRRYLILKTLLRAGKISDLQCQRSFELVPTQKNSRGETEVCVRYVADFAYIDNTTGRTVVEDVKSDLTKKLPIYIIKRKLMLQVHGITIEEV